ncbi:hypothetical protein [Streptomyces sp. NRRL B-1347]|uniref:hypothetical protein n=1 Tax=Streptomyces sp. NRRL B-1347 TaxID=1476877 RepID=UPI0004C67B86|nr:hypothetical protein [Streptomyces sp. NRRL B-1347]
MDTSWWLALAAVVVLALVVTVVDGWGRGHRRSRGTGRGARRAPSASSAAVRPRAMEIWWAVADGAERPFLVLSVRGDAVRVATITTRFHDERAGVIPLPPGAVGDVRGRASFLEPDGVRELWAGDFRRRAGVVDPALWDQVRYLGG